MDLVAEFERAMLRERTRHGLVAVRKEGRIGGRRPKLNARQQKEVARLVNSGEKTAAEAARLFGVHPSTVARLWHEIGWQDRVRQTGQLQNLENKLVTLIDTTNDQRDVATRPSTAVQLCVT